MLCREVAEISAIHSYADRRYKDLIISMIAADEMNKDRFRVVLEERMGLELATLDLSQAEHGFEEGLHHFVSLGPSRLYKILTADESKEQTELLIESMGQSYPTLFSTLDLDREVLYNNNYATPTNRAARAQALLRFEGDDVDTSPNAAWVLVHDGKVTTDYFPINGDINGSYDYYVDKSWVIWDLERLIFGNFDYFIQDIPSLSALELLFQHLTPQQRSKIALRAPETLPSRGLLSHDQPERA